MTLVTPQVAFNPDYRIIHVDDEIITIEHDGDITWDEIQKIKNEFWGEETEAIELYPAESRVINKVHQRHIWKVPEGMPLPDLVGGWNR